MFDQSLKKLTIASFADSFSLQSPKLPGSAFEAMFNPESFTINTQINYCTENAHGSTSSPAKFRNIEPRTFSVDLTLDGTGANGESIIPVPARIKLFELTVGYFGAVHRPNFLIVAWGSFIITCVLESYSINYKLFNNAGIPLRAVISASFKEHRPKLLEKLINNDLSADLTHQHEVLQGDRLPDLVENIYEDSKYYVQVAGTNQLNNLKKLKAGSQLLLPPLQTS